MLVGAVAVKLVSVAITGVIGRIKSAKTTVGPAQFPSTEETRSYGPAFFA